MDRGRAKVGRSPPVNPDAYSSDEACRRRLAKNVRKKNPAAEMVGSLHPGERSSSCRV